MTAPASLTLAALIQRHESQRFGSATAAYEAAGMQASVAGQPAPFNVWVMDVDAFIRQHGVQRVNATAIYEPSSTEFHTDGLFSERIFGQIGTPERLQRFGYIELNATLLAPVLYKAVVKLSGFYDDVMAGRAHAVFDEATRELKPARDVSVPGAGTGYTFFLDHFPKLAFRETESYVREARLAILDRYRSTGLYQRIPVLPAGLRDIQADGGRLSQDDINKLYSAVLSYAFGIEPGRDPLYDGVRYHLQKKVVEIYDHLEALNTGKRGFLLGAYGSRRLAGGTRNVITAAPFDGLSPDDPQLIKHDETKVGLFQSMKALQPLIVHHLRSAILLPIFGDGDAPTVALTNPDTLGLEYVRLPRKELARFTTTEGIEGWINRFRNADVRALPITAHDVSGKRYYVCLVYDTGDEIALFRSRQDLERFATGPIDASKIRPLTWIEAMYMVTHMAATNRVVMVTRYPVIQDQSCYPSKLHVTTTDPARVVVLRDLINDFLLKSYPQYPVLGASFSDSVAVHSSRLAGLGADHDGDTVSVNALWSDDANQQALDYLNSVSSVINTRKQFISGGMTDLIALTFANLSRL